MHNTLDAEPPLEPVPQLYSLFMGRLSQRYALCTLGSICLTLETPLYPLSLFNKVWRRIPGHVHRNDWRVLAILRIKSQSHVHENFRKNVYLSRVWC